MLDEYVEGDQVVVFVHGTVITLSPLATRALLRLTDSWTEASDVADMLVEEFGSPPSGVNQLVVTRTTLESLAALGVAELSE